MKCLNISHPEISKFLDIVKSEVALNKILNLFPENYFPTEKQVVEEWNKNFIENLQNRGILSKQVFRVNTNTVLLSIPKEFREENAVIGRSIIPNSKDYKMLDELEYEVALGKKDWIKIKESKNALYVEIPKDYYRPQSPVKLREAIKIKNVIDNVNNIHPYYNSEVLENNKIIEDEPYLRKVISKGKDLINSCNFG